MTRRSVAFASFFVLATFPAFAFDEPGNVLKDFEFNATAASWGVKDPKRGQIESFEGLAEPLFYLEGRDGGRLHQSFNVETQTWYVLSFRYRLTGDGKGDAVGGIPFDCAVSVAPGEVDGNFPAKALNSMNLGGTENWARARMYFQTGKDPRASLNIGFFSGSWQIGRIFVRKANDRDRLAGGALCDPQFEATAPGDLPHEWRITGKHDVRRLTFTEEEAHGGKRALKAVFSKSADLVTPLCGFAKHDDILRASVWIKVSRRTLVDFKMTNPMGGVRRFNCHELKWVEPDRWTRFEVSGTPRCQPERRGHTGVLFYILAKTEDDAETTLLADDLNYSVIAPESLSAAGDPTKPEIANRSFEEGPVFGQAGFSVDSTNVHDGVVRDFAVDATTAAVGACSLKVRGDGFGFQTEPFRCFADKPYTFSFYAKSTKKMKIHAAFPYAMLGEWEIGPEWKRYHGTREPKREYVAPGYCNIRFRTIDVAPDNVLWLDGFQIDYGPELKPFRAAPCEIGATFAAIYKIFTVGSTPQLDLRVANGGAKPLAGEVVLTEKDLRGAVTRVERIPVTVATGQTWHKALDYSVREPGYHRVETDFVAGGKTLAHNVTTYAGVYPPKGVPFAESWAGILGGFDDSGRNGSTKSSVRVTRGTWNDGLDALSLMGFRWLRTMACGNWRNTEYPQGTYNWKWDDYLADAKAHGMGVMVEFLCHDAPPWSHGRDLKTKVQGGFRYSMRPADVETFAEDFARHYAGKFDSINLLNETGGHPADDYVELMEATYKGFKRVDPKIIVQGPGFPSSRFPLLVETPGQETWIQKALDCGLNRWNDVHGIHPYDAGHAFHISTLRRQPFERSVSDNPGGNGCTSYEYLREQARRFKAKYANGTIWDTETGAQFNTVAPGQFSPSEARLDWYTERLAAARAIRCNILRWSVGCERQFYFTFKFGLIYHGLDLMNYDMTPRAGVAAIANFNRVLDGGRFERIEELADGTFTAYFKGWKGEKILVYWNPDMDEEEKVEKRTPRFDLPSGCKVVSAYDMEGVELKTLPLSCEPVYVIYR